MPNNDWLEQYVSAEAEKNQARLSLQEEINHVFRVQLAHQNLNLQLKAQPVGTADPFSPPQMKAVGVILDIYKFIPPYLNNASLGTISLGPATAAVKSQSTGIGTYNPAGYATQVISDQSMGKMTAISHVDFWNQGLAEFSRTYLEFNTSPIDRDYTQLTILLNYMLDHKLEYTLNPNQTLQYSQQINELTVTVKEFWPSGMDSGRSLPQNEVLHKYAHTYLMPSGPMTLKKVEKPKQYLKKLDIPQAKKDNYYKIILELYSYSWIAFGRAASEINFVHIPAY